jgi:hypothetical protein
VFRLELFIGVIERDLVFRSMMHIHLKFWRVDLKSISYLRACLEGYLKRSNMSISVVEYDSMVGGRDERCCTIDQNRYHRLKGWRTGFLYEPSWSRNMC